MICRNITALTIHINESFIDEDIIKQAICKIRQRTLFLLKLMNGRLEEKG